MRLVEISLDTLMIFQPKLFYVLDSDHGFIEPVKLEHGEFFIWDSSDEDWYYINKLDSCPWIKKVRIFQLEEEESNEQWF